MNSSRHCVDTNTTNMREERNAPDGRGSSSSSRVAAVATFVTQEAAKQHACSMQRVVPHNIPAAAAAAKNETRAQDHVRFRASHTASNANNNNKRRRIMLRTASPQGRQLENKNEASCIVNAGKAPIKKGRLRRDDVVEGDEVVEVGTQVYCCFSNRQYYWGLVSARRPNNGRDPARHPFVYSVDFHDGDKLKRVSRGRFMTEERYRALDLDETTLPVLQGSPQQKKDEGKARASLVVAAQERQKAGGRRNEQDEECAQDHVVVLVGKKFYQQWVDVHGNRKEIYGTISRHDPSEECPPLENEFTVTFSKASRAIANSLRNDCGCSVPETGQMSFERALGGCIMYDRVKKTTLLPDEMYSMHHCRWIVPDVRQESFVTASDASRLPHLMMTLQGFKLEFSVKKKSMIDNKRAGNGVFMTCETLDDSSDETELVLEPGTLLDLGVYSPLCAQDKKPGIIFLMKNFVHSYKCQAYALEAMDPEYQLDITDDVTGEAHAIANEKIATYVNECSSSDETPMITAMHDPEGSVHYLLGHRHESEGKLVIPANGKEIEVFVDYGAAYEDVKTRSSDSGLSGEELAEAQRRLEREELEHIHAVERFSLQDVDLCVNYFCGVFSGEIYPRDPIVVARCALAAVLLHKRVDKKLFDFEEDILDSEDGEATEEDFRQVWTNARRLLTLLVNLMPDNRIEYHRLVRNNELLHLEKKILKQLNLDFAQAEDGEHDL